MARVLVHMLGEKLKIINLAYSYLRHVIGDGASTFFWFDNWHQFSPLIKGLSYGQLIRTGITMNAEVGEVTATSYLGRGRCRLLGMQHIQEAIFTINICPDRDDMILWIADKKNMFTVSSAWDTIREKGPEVNWHRLVWFYPSIPRYSFISWLAIHNRLQTLDRQTLFMEDWN
ncbi:uncharacterized protein LOC116212320 [Punica granatum]|uniref:Uncharacterized protein LOC116212320 n=1 Tax=Punica granatum TaxID=22663 RepID=A0A6P8EBJ3_PUNGR|nr:uncharacterized protein LOC116212320 [Punica granatum]